MNNDSKILYCRALLELTIQCDDENFDIYINGHFHDTFSDAAAGFVPDRYTINTQSNKKNIEFIAAEYKYYWISIDIILYDYSG